MDRACRAFEILSGVHLDALVASNYCKQISKGRYTKTVPKRGVKNRMLAAHEGHFPKLAVHAAGIPPAVLAATNPANDGDGMGDPDLVAQDEHDLGVLRLKLRKRDARIAALESELATDARVHARAAHMLVHDLQGKIQGLEYALLCGQHKRQRL